MSAVVVTGTQWGDEGKGKIVDYLAEKADTVVRYQGGSNAGHTVSVKGEEFKLRLLPSGILYHGKTNVVGNGVIFDPEVALEEMNAMQKRGIDTSGIRISNRAHVVLPYHRIMDGLAEEARGEGKIGTTKRGIGPCTMDKMNRIGIRVCDLVEPEEFRKRLKENLAIKDRLYRQIVNSDDSIGRLYRIVSRLDSVETENLYTQTASVTADILSVKDVVVYIVGEGGWYLRQKVRLGSQTHELPRSIRVEDNPYLVQMLQEKKIFVNRDLVKGLPDLAAPISYEGRVIAVLQIYNLDFEQWSLYQQNLLSITARLVSSSLARAYAWEQETADQKYLDNTRILRSEEFQKVIEEFRERRRMQPDYPVTLLALKVNGRSYSELDHQIAHSIRGEDFMGATETGVSVLLPDVAGKTLDMVRERLAKVGIETGESQAL